MFTAVRPLFTAVRPLFTAVRPLFTAVRPMRPVLSAKAVWLIRKPELLFLAVECHGLTMARLTLTTKKTTFTGVSRVLRRQSLVPVRLPSSRRKFSPVLVGLLVFLLGKWQLVALSLAGRTHVLVSLQAPT
jgi:hypothetical protein